jgi:hypothetical protein
MGMEDFSRHQQSIIKRYYSNSASVSMQRLAELVTELYLSEGAKRKKLWAFAAQALSKLEVPASRLKMVLESEDPAKLAELVSELQRK